MCFYIGELEEEKLLTNDNYSEFFKLYENTEQK